MFLLVCFCLFQPPARYWLELQKEGTDEIKVGKDTEQALPHGEKKTSKAKKRNQRDEEVQKNGKQFISGVRLLQGQLYCIYGWSCIYVCDKILIRLF